MIAMQYSFVLPADYDMAIIDRRIAEKGPLLDNLPKLRFKAYLSATRTGGPFASSDNLYAPFYVWDHPDGLSDFLCGPGFAALTQALGWPQVKTWVVWRAENAPDIAQARFATRDTVPIAPHADLDDLRRRESENVLADMAAGALAAVAGFEPTSWSFVRFRLWRDLPGPATDLQVYKVGHLSLPGI